MHKRILSGITIIVLTISQVLFSFPFDFSEVKEAHAATDRYASPMGSGTACTSASPCALQTALGQAVAGDTVIAMNGIYTGHYNELVVSFANGPNLL
jgi:hypothetical protein